MKADEFYTYVVNWVCQKSPQQLTSDAESGRDVVADMLPYLPVVRLFLTNQDYAEIEQMGESDWQRIIDRVLAQCPSRGLILWRHQRWFVAQLDAARKAILGVQ